MPRPALAHERRQCIGAVLLTYEIEQESEPLRVGKIRIEQREFGEPIRIHTLGEFGEHRGHGIRWTQVPDEVQSRGLGRQDAHRARSRPDLDHGRALHETLREKPNPVSAALGTTELDGGHDFKFLRLQVSRAEQRSGAQESHVVKSPVELHQVFDEPSNRRRARLPVLERDDDIETATHSREAPLGDQPLNRFPKSVRRHPEQIRLLLREVPHDVQNAAALELP